MTEPKPETSLNPESMSPEVDIYTLLQKQPADFTLEDCEKVCAFMQEEARNFAVAEKAKSTKSPAAKPKPKTSTRADVKALIADL